MKRATLLFYCLFQASMPQGVLSFLAHRECRDVLGTRVSVPVRQRKSPVCKARDNAFWEQQKAIMQEMVDRAEKSTKQEQAEKFASRRKALIGDTLFISMLIFNVIWVTCDNPFVSFSYIFGAVFGLAYAYGLGKYVETIGGSAEDVDAVQGAGVGQARFAFLILLVVFVGKLRASGLLEIPSIMGFFTYQLASLSQGLREIND